MSQMTSEEKLLCFLCDVSEAEALKKQSSWRLLELRHLVVWLVWFPLLALDVCQQTSHVCPALVVVNSMNLDVTETFTTVKQEATTFTVSDA